MLVSWLLAGPVDRAVMRRRTQKAKDKLSGFFYDVNHIATYVPYCDAVVLDSAMAELVSH
jgi:hypothetical protein